MISNQSILIDGKVIDTTKPYLNVKVIGALNECVQQWAFDGIKALRLEYYKKISTNGKNITQYKGWLNRMEKFNYKKI
jgi:hypothetical protein